MACALAAELGAAGAGLTPSLLLRLDMHAEDEVHPSALCSVKDLPSSTVHLMSLQLWSLQIEQMGNWIDGNSHTKHCALIWLTHWCSAMMPDLKWQDPTSSSEQVYICQPIGMYICHTRVSPGSTNSLMLPALHD